MSSQKRKIGTIQINALITMSPVPGIVIVFFWLR